MSNEINNRFDTYLPRFVLESKILKDIFDSIILESSSLNDYLKNCLDEMSISTVSKSIDKWEKFAGVSNPNLNLNERIDSVIKKFSYQIHANYYNFLQLLKTYDDTTELKEITDEYRIEIKTKNYISYEEFLNYLSIINNYKPAHIGVSIELNREYTMSYNMGNILTNVKSITVETKIQSPKDLKITKSSINFILLQNKYLNIRSTNKISNNHCVKCGTSIIIQKFKTFYI